MRCDLSSSFKAVTEFMSSGLDEAVVKLPPPNTQDAMDYDSGSDDYGLLSP
jgi:hypothetical protein